MPIDLTIHEKTLRYVALRKSDFINFPRIQNPQILQQIIDQAEIVGETGFDTALISQSTINGKNTLKIRSLEHELVMRLVMKSIARLTGVRQSNRTTIIRCIKELISEGVNYRIYKLDIKSFYESVDRQSILRQLQNDQGFSRQSLSLIESFFIKTASLGIQGLPRGIAISSTLAEYAMRTFDRFARSNVEIFFYARFVDDIIIISSGRESPKPMIKSLSSHLPDGLGFNVAKTKILDLQEAPSSSPFKTDFDFLGYKLQIHSRKKTPRPIRRVIDVDIARSKVSKIKTRIVRSAIQYNQDHIFRDLIDRLRLLSGNYTVYDHSRGVRRSAGIYYNYQLIDKNSQLSLIQLDEFMRAFFLSKCGSVCTKLAQSLSNAQRRRILRLSFERGFKRKVFYNFPGNRLVELMRCWKYG